MYAEYEMSLDNYHRARSILFLGAQSFSESSDGSLHSENFARLFHSWAVCEWYLGSLDRAEVLFDHSLRVTDSSSRGAETRSLILFSIARFLFHAREDLSLAQHCVSLSLTENSRSKESWILWSKIAQRMGNMKLASSCEEESKKLYQKRGQEEAIPKMNQMLRRSPWHHKIFNLTQESGAWYESIKFPDESKVRNIAIV